MPTKESQTVLDTQTSRREVLKKVAWVTPVILTLTAIPAFAANGSGKPTRAGSAAGRGPQ